MSDQTDGREFTRKCIASRIATSAEITMSNDWIRDELWHTLDAFVLVAQEQEDVIELPRPRFSDWLLRRRRTCTVTVRDVLLDPPVIPKHETVRMYSFGEDT